MQRILDFFTILGNNRDKQGFAFAKPLCLNCTKKGMATMATVFDIAKYILTKESMSHKKLQKLCYYAQGWNLAFLGHPLFDESIEAWVHGPVVRALYPYYADYGWNPIPQQMQEPNLSDTNKAIINAVWEAYGEFSGGELEALSHSETPWKNAREGLAPYEASSNEISIDSIKSYFDTLRDANPDV